MSCTAYHILLGVIRFRCMRGAGHMVGMGGRELNTEFSGET